MRSNIQTIILMTFIIFYLCYGQQGNDYKYEQEGHTFDRISSEIVRPWRLNNPKEVQPLVKKLFKGGFLINKGQPFTDQSRVNLDLAVSEAVKMRFSNDGQNFSPWERVRPSRQWILRTPGRNTIWGEFQAKSGNTVTLRQSIRWIVKILAYPGSIHFGASLAVSRQGDTIAIGAFGDDDGKGAVYLVKWHESEWRYERVIAPEYDRDERDGFGTSIGLSGDGKVLAVGAPGKAGKGAVYLYGCRNGQWRYQARLYLYNLQMVSEFGYSLALAADGKILVVGAYRYFRAKGAAFIYQQTARGWQLQSILRDRLGSAGDHFGISVSCSKDGAVVMVGAEGYQGKGAVNIYQRDGFFWKMKTRIVDSLGKPGDQFGSSVALSGNGMIAVIGADGYHSKKGKGMVFRFNEYVWQYMTSLHHPAGESGDFYARSLGITEKGGLIVIGLKGHQQGQGGVLFYSKGTRGYHQEFSWIDLAGSRSDLLGGSLAVSGNGSRVVIPVQGDDQKPGGVYVY